MIRTPDKTRIRDRHVDYEWSIGTNEKGGTDWIGLSVWHNKYNGCYRASLDVFATERGMTCYRINGKPTPYVARWAVARFNQKKLEAFASETLANLEALTNAIPQEEPRTIGLERLAKIQQSVEV